MRRIAGIIPMSLNAIAISCQKVNPSLANNISLTSLFIVYTTFEDNAILKLIFICKNNVDST